MAERSGERDKRPRLARALLAAPKRLLLSFGVIFGLLLLLFIASFFIDEPLRRIIERNMNRQMKGYTVHLADLHFQPISLSTTVKGLTITQDAHPDPPVGNFPNVHADVQWREILAGKLVAEVSFDRPKIHINLKQLRSEAASEKKVSEKGWQQAFSEIHPFKINSFEITEGDLVYIDEDPDRPLHLGRVNLSVGNIRNIRSPDQVYPSSFYLEASVFGTGQAVVDGNANFLADPFPGINAGFELKDIPLYYFRPILARSDISLKKGEMFASGRIEYAPKVQTAHVKDLTLKGLDVEYVSDPAKTAAAKKRGKKVAKAAEEASNKPGLLLRMDDLQVTGSTVGMTVKGEKPYRVFLSDTNLHLTNLSNQFLEGTAKAELSGKFMGSGTTLASATFRPEKQGPDFDLFLKIENTQMKAMNKMLQAYGNFDVVEGLFSFFTELHVKNNAVTGYIKPLFRDMKVYDRRQDKEKGVFRKMYEMLVGGVANMLENRPREEVATKADISGPIKEPYTSTLQVIVELLTNAFFRAILPGFEREVSGQRR